MLHKPIGIKDLAFLRRKNHNQKKKVRLQNVSLGHTSMGLRCQDRNIHPSFAYWKRSLGDYMYNII
jgi:hypothetical protein